MATEEETTVTKGEPRVFVYGSLKAGHGNHRLLEDYTYLGPAYIEGPYRLMSLGFFPAVTKAEYDPLHDAGKPDSIRVYGEVYGVDPEGLHALDLLEGHPHFYKRSKVKTNVDDFGSVWCYFMQADHNPQREIFPAIWKPDEAELLIWKEELERDQAA